MNAVFLLDPVKSLTPTREPNSRVREEDPSFQKALDDNEWAAEVQARENRGAETTRPDPQDETGCLEKGPCPADAPGMEGKDRDSRPEGPGTTRDRENPGNHTDSMDETCHALTSAVTEMNPLHPSMMEQGAKAGGNLEGIQAMQAAGAQAAGMPGSQATAGALTAGMAGSQAKTGALNTMPIPDLMEKVVAQVKSHLSSGTGEIKVTLAPEELDALKLRFSNEGSLSQAGATAGAKAMGAALESSLQQLRNMLARAGIAMDQVILIQDEGGSTASHSQSQDAFSSLFGGMAEARNTNFQNLQASAGASTPFAQIMANHHGIQNLQEHIFNQIRIQLSPSQSEARIRLTPAELGEIKIHMVMEDQRLTVRMEVSEGQVRHLLEKDIQQLKDSLADAGIDVHKFDINAKKDPSRGGRGHGAEQGSSAMDEEEKEDGEFLQNTRSRETVDLAAGAEGVDYLVY